MKRTLTIRRNNAASLQTLHQHWCFSFGPPEHAPPDSPPIPTGSQPRSQRDHSLDPNGITAISRWSSEAIPPEHGPKQRNPILKGSQHPPRCHPSGVRMGGPARDRWWRCAYHRLKPLRGSHGAGLEGFDALQDLVLGQGFGDRDPQVTGVLATAIQDDLLVIGRCIAVTAWFVTVDQ